MKGDPETIQLGPADQWHLLWERQCCHSSSNHITSHKLAHSASKNHVFQFYAKRPLGQYVAEKGSLLLGDWERCFKGFVVLCFLCFLIVSWEEKVI